MATLGIPLVVSRKLQRKKRREDGETDSYPSSSYGDTSNKPSGGPSRSKRNEGFGNRQSQRSNFNFGDSKTLRSRETMIIVLEIQDWRIPKSCFGSGAEQQQQSLSRPFCSTPEKPF